jgi:hypothetical protein
MVRSFKDEKDKIRLTIGEFIAKNYIELTKDDSLICINKNDKTVFKKYANKNSCRKVVKKVPKCRNYLFDDKFIPKNDVSIYQTY